MKKGLKLALSACATIVGILLLIIAVVVIINTIKINKELRKANEYGLINQIDYENKKINVLSLGNENSEYAIVPIAGLGMNNYNFHMKEILKPCFDDYQVVLIDRLGYGLSSDTKEEQTIENIVDFYRKVLKQLSITKKIVLVAHSIGGLYATYWENMFPEEIGGVIYLDGSIPTTNFVDTQNTTKGDYVTTFFCKLGFQRLFNKLYEEQSLTFAVKKELQEYVRIYDNKNISSHALINESINRPDNYKKAYECIKKNDIPKQYVFASCLKTKENFVELYEYINWLFEQNGKGKILDDVKAYVDEKVTDEILAEYEKIEKEQVIPFVESLGSCEIIYLPGMHTIYEQKPEEVGKIVISFMKSL